MRVKILLLLILILQISFSCTDNKPKEDRLCFPQIDVSVDYRKPEHNDIKSQQKGYFSNHNEVIGIVDNNDTIAVIELSEPSIVAIADSYYRWGWFQFPKMGVSKEGIISVEWQMKNDSAADYGDQSGINNTKISYDYGDTWVSPPSGTYIPVFRESVSLPNGDLITISTQPSEDITNYSDFPDPVFTYGNNDFYFEKDLPEKFKGVYVNYFHDNIKDVFHANVNNDNLIRYSVNGTISTFWFGKLAMKDQELYAGVYPSYYTDKNGDLTPTSISFYKSSDWGRTWSLQGVINYQIYDEYHPATSFNNKGFAEPTFEFLKDGRIMCVMRTTLGGIITPMYKSYSQDYGVSWSKPEPITPNGVMPELVRLDNEVLVLASGRPGVQLRFSCDGIGEKWSSPIEMINYDENDVNAKDDYTCGYPFLYKVSDNEVYIVYSNFKEKDVNGELRKSILFRKIKVKIRKNLRK